MGCQHSTNAKSPGGEEVSGSQVQNPKNVSQMQEQMPKSFKESYYLVEGKDGKLGSGQFSVVRKGVNIETQQVCAVKIMKKAEMKQEDFEAYEIEKRVMHKLRNHPNLIHLMQDFEDEDHYYLVMEMACGGELFHKIVERETYTEEEARVCIIALVEAIDFCHQRGVVHRDLKPENVLLRAEDDETIKIADFGFAKELGTTSDGLLHTACGTPGYVAPEILRQKPYGAEVDIWSLGVIFYILLCGYPPFHADNQQKLFSQIKKADYAFDSPDWDDISDDAKDLISKILVPDPKKRFTAREILNHVWMTEGHVGDKNLGKTVENMKKFNARRKFRAAGAAVRTTVRMRMLLGGAPVASEEDDSSPRA